MRPANFMWRQGINIDKRYMFDHQQKQKFYYFKTVTWIFCEISWPGNLFKKNRRLKDKDGEGVENIVQIL